MSAGPDRPVESKAGGLYGGRYAVEEELGRGGMGRVLRARDLKLGRLVALKLLAPGTHEGKQLRRFEQEARAAGALNHPNIVTVFDAGEHEGEPYIVTELLQGRTVRALLKEGPIPVEKAADFALQLAQGLAAAHQAGIVHRDLKPENLFVTDEGRLKILDFGVAKLAGDGNAGVSTETGAVIGTAGYMSPEQVRGVAADYRSDIFTFGTILHEMLSGSIPFQRPSPAETGYAIVNDPPPALPAAVPSRLAQIVSQCLAKDPAQRLPSSAGLVAALPRAMASIRLRTLRRTAAFVLAAVLLAAGGAIWRWQQSRTAGPAPPEVIAILPFSVRGATSLAYLGEGMVDLLSTTLATPSLRTVDPHALLAMVVREGWAPDPERGRAVALRFGAKHFVLGSIVEAGPKLRIHASIYLAGSGTTPVREVNVEGEPARMLELIDELSARIRSGDESQKRKADRMTRVAEATTSSPAALTAYLDGKRLARVGRFNEAHAAFQRAVAADPSFALAHYEVSKKDSETSGVFDYESLDRALELGRRLPEQTQKQMMAWNAFAHGRYEEAERLAREVVRMHPDDVDTWELLSNTQISAGMRPYSELKEAAEKALVLEPRSLPALGALIDGAVVSGQYEEAVALLDRLLEVTAANASPNWNLAYGWERAVLAADDQERARIVQELRRGESEFLTWAWMGSPWLPDGLALGEELLDAMLDPARPAEVRHWGERGRAWNELVRGRRHGREQHLEAALAIRDSPGVRLDLAGSSKEWFLFAPIPREKLLAERAAVAAFDASPSTALPLRENRMSSLALLDALLGDDEALERALLQLETGDWGYPAGSTQGSDNAMWLRAVAAWKAGRPADALAKLQRFRGQVPLQPWWYWFMPKLSYLKGEVLLQLGQDDEAARQFQIVRSAMEPFISPRFRRLAQIEERRGNKDKAISYYRRFVELWKDCDPELRPQVDEARAHLAALRR